MFRIHRFAPIILISGLLAGSAFAQELMAVKGAPNPSKFKATASPVSKETKLRIGLSFKGFNKAGANALFAQLYDPNSPNFHHWIKTREFGRRFGPSDADVEAVTEFLNDRGFTNVSLATSRLFISAETTIGNAEKVFTTHYSNFARPTELIAEGEPAEFFAPATQPKLPASIASRINGVHGLSNLAIQHPAGFHKVAKVQAPQQNSGGYVPSQLSTGYDSAPLQKTYKGQGMNIGIYSPTLRYFDDPIEFAKDIGVNPFTIYDVLVDGGPTTGGDAAGEAALDIETIGGQAPSATIFAIDGPGANETEQGELDCFDAVGNIESIPVLSSSWDFEEATIIAGDEQAFATDFEDLCEALSESGVSILVASGDSGAYSNTGSNAITTKMETSCPYVTSVGGTALYLTSANAYSHEAAWDYTTSPKPSGGGGGLSKLYARPSWQVGPGVSNSHSNGKRQVPDVSANASGLTPYAIIVDGGVEYVYGTSASTPLWSSNILDMLGEYSAIYKSTVFVGCLNPALYQLGNWFENPAQDISADFYLYHDITTGTNGVYSGTVDWDFVTGWGSANFYKLWLDLAFYYNLGSYKPDYIPYDPASGGWTHPLMIHASSTSIAEPASFSHTTPYYIAVCSKNQGAADGPSCANTIKVDGVVVKTVEIAAIPEGSYNTVVDAAYLTFTKGAHTITFTVNSSSAIKEQSTTNNTYSRTITVN